MPQTKARAPLRTKTIQQTGSKSPPRAIDTTIEGLRKVAQNRRKNRSAELREKAAAAKKRGPTRVEASKDVPGSGHMPPKFPGLEISEPTYILTAAAIYLRAGKEPAAAAVGEGGTVHKNLAQLTVATMPSDQSVGRERPTMEAEFHGDQLNASISLPELPSVLRDFALVNQGDLQYRLRQPDTSMVPRRGEGGKP